MSNDEERQESGISYQALALLTTIGEEHFIYAGTMNNLGLLYYEMGNLERAKECLEHSLHILEGKEEYIIPYATTLHNLVDIYKKEGEIFKAEQTLKQKK
ncbi:MAG: tetratricopeptide repeat protein [Anaerobutyricum sp.]